MLWMRRHWSMAACPCLSADDDCALLCSCPESRFLRDGLHIRHRAGPCYSACRIQPNDNW